MAGANIKRGAIAGGILTVLLPFPAAFSSSHPVSAYVEVFVTCLLVLAVVLSVFVRASGRSRRPTDPR